LLKHQSNDSQRLLSEFLLIDCPIYLIPIFLLYAKCCVFYDSKAPNVNKFTVLF
jgi:hypothetical protein